MSSTLSQIVCSASACFRCGSPEAAAEELRRAVTELGIRGFEFVTTGPPLALGDPFYDPVYKAAEELGGGHLRPRHPQPIAGIWGLRG